jgi:hypothetical protein
MFTREELIDFIKVLENRKSDKDHPADRKKEACV